MLIYENIDEINYIALQTSEATNDDNEIQAIRYENDVEINYTIDKTKKIIHILYIEAKEKNKGNGSNALNEFIQRFSNYDIEVDALFFLEKWYEKFNFKFQYAMDDMLCYKMKLERKV